MAMLCVVPPDGVLSESAFLRSKIPSISRTGWDKKIEVVENVRNMRQLTGLYGARPERRYHTAMAIHQEGNAYTRLQRNTRPTYTQAFEEASVLVAELLQQLRFTFVPDGLPLPLSQVENCTPSYALDEELARSSHNLHPSAPVPPRSRSREKTSEGRHNMFGDVDLGDTSGFQTRGNKKAKKAAKQAQQSKWTDDPEEGEKAGEGGEDGGSGGGGGGEEGGSGGGGGDENGGGDDGKDEEDDWNFGGGKKNKKKTSKKKQQEEEEEDERKKKEEEEAANANKADPLSWADDTNDAAGADDWTTGFTVQKDKKKKKKGASEEPVSALPEPPAVSNFQDISLDDGAPKIDFSFESGDAKKDTGFGTWGKSWDFGSVDKPDDKKSKETKDSSTTFGDNNPWSLGGSKNKKKTTTSGFDFGNFGASDEITFDTGDLGDTKATDDAWGFSAVNKKDKKKKKDDLDEKPSTAAVESAPVVEDSWGTWGTTSKKKGKKDAFDNDVAPPPAAPEPPTTDEWSSFGFGKKDKKKVAKEVEEPIMPEPEPEPVDTFDWGFGSKKDKKKKGLIDEIKEDPPADPPAEPESAGGGGDDWVGGWGTTTKKKEKKGKKSGIEDLSASIDLGSTADTNATKEEPAGDDLWAFGTSKKDKKKGKKGLLEDESLSPSVTETPAAVEGDIWSTFGQKTKKGKATSPDPIDDPFPEEAEPVKEEPPAWDFGLTAAQKKKKEKEMRKANLWPFGDIGKPVEPEPEPEFEYTPEEIEIVPDEKVELVKETPPAWDFGLSEKDRKKKEKEMKKKNLWPFGDIGKPVEPEIISEPIAEEQEVAEPVKEETPPWDFGLTPSQKKKKEKEMRKANQWPFGDIGKPLEPEPEPEPKSNPEADLLQELDLEQELEAPKEEIPPWDFGLTPSQKKKKEKDMKKANLWPFGDIGKPVEKKAEKEFEPEDFPEEVEQEPEREPEPEVEEPPAWDFGLTEKERKKKEKEMKKKNLWPFGDIGKPVKAEPEPEPELQPEIEPEPEVETEAEPAKTDMWGTWGMTNKEKKKKESKTKSAEPEPAAKSVKEEETTFDDGGWGFGLSSKDKKKKEKDTKKQDPLSLAEETPSAIDSKPAEDDMWGSFSAAKSKDTKKSKKGKTVEEPPPPVPTPPAQGLSPEPAPVEDTQLDAFDDDTWGGLAKTKSKTKSPVEEKKSSIWGFGNSTKTKTKKEKDSEAKAQKEAEDKAARDAEDAAAREEEERLQREIDEAEAAEAAEAAAAAAAAAAAKPAKKAKDSKSAKSSGKLLDEKKKSKEVAPLDLLDETMPAEEKAVERNEDYFGFWGSAATKKTAGKKDKEITRKELTNESDPLADFTNLDLMASDNAEPLPSKSSKALTGKGKVGSSIADRIKALEAKKSGKEDSGMKKVSNEPITKDEFALDEALSPKEEKKAGKTKTSSKSKKDDAFPPPSPVAESKGKKSKESVPGSFPDAFGEEEEDLLADEPVPPAQAEPNKVKKIGKADKKSAKSSKKVKAQEDPEPVVEKDLMDDLLDLDSPKLPTPPPEEKKPARKERARVERTGTTAAWGFWGAAPPKKKESSKKKTSGDTTPPLVEKEKKPSPALGRSKSTRTPKEVEKEDKRESEKISKSSDSDKDSKKTERPSKPARGMSFSQFIMGGPPPSAMRSKPSRRSSNAGGGSRSSSRARSAEGGLMSPPPEDAPEASGKAAKLMGIKSKGVERKRSVKTKSSAYVDPYPIDDDDMVMINAPEIQSPPAVEKKSKGKVSARRASTKPRSKTISGDEDVVMVDNVVAEPFVTSGPEEFAPSLKRGNSVQNPTGFFGSFFGGTKAVAEPKQVLTDAEDTALPIRTKSTSKRRSRIPEADGGFTTDAPMETDADNEARSVQRKAKRDAYRIAEEEERAEREKRRRERREREQADLEARRARARDRARKQQEEEEAQKEVRRERRRQKEAERERAAQTELELNAAADQRRSERARLRAELEAANPDGIPSKEERRQTYLAEEDGRQRRREGRRPKDDTSRRKSSALVAEYHNSRSGKGGGIAPPANKTSSWIASQNDEPPDVPPISETILDPSGEKPRSIEEVDDGSGSRRRKDKHSGMTEAEIEEHRARRARRRVEREKAMSGGSDDRGRSRKDYDAYAEPVKTFDGRPALARGDSKRNSFLGRFF